MKSWRNIVGLVVASLVIGGFTVSHAQAASLFIAPSSGSFVVGQTINVTVRLNSAGQAINASEATLRWSSDTLQFVSVTGSGSIFKYWPVDPVVQGTSTVLCSGGLPSPGYTGAAGTVIRITLKAKAAGTGTLTVSGAKILANDGQGTDVYTGSSGATYAIAAATTPESVPTTPSVPNRPSPVVTSPTHPEQKSWYRDSAATLTWTSPVGAEGYSYDVTTSATTVPSETVAQTITTKTLSLVADGTWYFHLRAKYSTGWSGTTHFALHLDRTPPDEFTPTVQQNRGPSDPSPSVLFSSKDSGSGVVRYTVAIDGGDALEASSPYELDGLKAGTHSVLVTAYDAAGNTRQATATLAVVGYTAPTITSVSSPLILLDPLIIRGTANLGDTVTVMVNNQVAGQLVVGAAGTQATPGVVMRLPWVLTSDLLFRPGVYSVTATATSSDGQVSATTDPREMKVVGRSVMLNGRPVATFSVVTPLIILALAILGLLIAVMAKLGLSVWLMHRHEVAVEEEIEVLRGVNRRQNLTRQQIESALAQIEDDLERPVPPMRKRRSAKRGR